MTGRKRYVGIFVEFNSGGATIHVGSSRRVVTSRQGALIELLARGMPNPIGRVFLRDRLFGHANIARSDAELDMLAMEARAAAEAVGLDLREIKGVGYQLRMREAA